MEPFFEGFIFMVLITIFVTALMTMVVYMITASIVNWAAN